MAKIIDKALVIERPDGQWLVRLVSDNGEIIMSSELYTNKLHAEDVANDIGVPMEIQAIDR